MIAAGLLLVLAAGWLFDRPGLFAALYLLAVVVLQASSLIRFERWLRQRKVLKPPSLPGLWGDVVDNASRLYRRKTFHKRRVLMLLREFRRSLDVPPAAQRLRRPRRRVARLSAGLSQFVQVPRDKRLATRRILLARVRANLGPEQRVQQLIALRRPRRRSGQCCCTSSCRGTAPPAGTGGDGRPPAGRSRRRRACPLRRPGGRCGGCRSRRWSRAR